MQLEGTESHLGASQRNYKETQFISPRKITCVFYHCSMHEVWSQELQCYRTRNASLVGLKYTCFYPCSVRIVSGQIFRIFLPRPYAARERKPNISLDDLRRCCPLTQGHSAWLFSLFGSLYFTVCKNRYTHSLIIPQYSVVSSAVKRTKLDGSLFKFFVEQFGNPSNTSK